MLPRYSPWRPDFEAPGPHVRIRKKEGLQLDDPFGNPWDSDGDDDPGYTRTGYYESEKILGKLYRAIHERKIFAEIKARSHWDGDLENHTLIHAVWENVKSRCRLIEWEHKREWAENLRDMYVSYSSCYLRPTKLTTAVKVRRMRRQHYGGVQRPSKKTAHRAGSLRREHPGAHWCPEQNPARALNQPEGEV